MLLRLALLLAIAACTPVPRATLSSAVAEDAAAAPLPRFTAFDEEDAAAAPAMEGHHHHAH